MKSMRRFLEAVGPLEVERHHKTWIEVLGPELFSLLVATRLLDPRGAADWWPCGDPGCGATGCPRAIVPSGRTDTPLIAVCGSVRSCGDEFLRVVDTELFAPSWTRFVALLRHVLRIDGEAPPIEVYPRVFSLGTTLRDGTAREALVALSPNDPGFGFYLSSRHAAPSASVVFVPSARRVPPLLAAQCARGCRVELVALDEVLVADNGRLAMRWPATATAPVTSAAPSVSHPFRALTERGELRLTRDDYEAVVRTAEHELGLFIDYASTITVDGKRKPRHRAGFRSKQTKAWKIADLMPDQAELLVQYVERRGMFVMPRELPVFAGKGPGDNSAILHRVQITRALVDEEPWHWFKTDSASQGRDLAYTFAPEDGARFAVISRLP